MNFRIDAGHPCLPGHFPGNAIVPGVVLLDEVAALLVPPGWRVAGFPAVRFLRPVRPGELVELAAVEGRFTATVAGEVAIQGAIQVVKADP